MSTALCWPTAKHLLATVKNAHVCRLQADCATGQQHHTCLCIHKLQELWIDSSRRVHASRVFHGYLVSHAARCQLQKHHARTLVLVAAGIEFLQAATTPSPFRRSKHIDALANQLSTATKASSCSGFGRAA